MARRGHANPVSLAITTLLIALFALLPMRLTGWASAFRGPVMTVIAPVAAPLSGVATWLRATGTAGGVGRAADLETLEAVTRERDRLARLYLQSLAEVDELRELLEDLQRVTARRGASVRQLEGRRVGVNLPAGTIDYDRGSLHGVTLSGVALSRRGEQLVGAVTRVGPTVSTVHLITDARADAPLMVGVVIPVEDGRERFPSSEEGLDALPRCQLVPVGDGTLVDRSFGAPIGGGREAAVGDLVRLLDESWPSSAQMAVLGRVIAVEPSDEPLFRRLRVAPLSDVQRLRSVILLVPSDDGVVDGGGVVGSGGDG